MSGDMVTTSAGGGTVVRPQGGGPTKSLEAFLKSRVDQLAQWVQRGTDPAALIRFVLFDYAQSPALQRCTPASIYLALVAAARAGLEPGGMRQEGWIIPYGQTALFQPGWRGLVRLAIRSGQVKSVRAHVVHEADIFEPDLGSEERIVHRPVLRDRGEIIGAYALAKMSDGSFEPELMAIDELEHVRETAIKLAHGKESPAWREWRGEMFRKTVIKRLCKRLPTGPEYARAAALDNAVESSDVAAYRRVIDVDVPEADELAAPEPAPPPQVAAPPSRGVSGAKEKLRRGRAAEPPPAAPPRAEPPPATVDPRQVAFPMGEPYPIQPHPATPRDEPEEEVDELGAEIRALFEAFETALAHPERVPALRHRVKILPPGPDREALEGLLTRTERALAADAKRAATEPPFEERAP